MIPVKGRLWVLLLRLGRGAVQKVLLHCERDTPLIPRQGLHSRDLLPWELAGGRAKFPVQTQEVGRKRVPGVPLSETCGKTSPSAVLVAWQDHLTPGQRPPGETSSVLGEIFNKELSVLPGSHPQERRPWSATAACRRRMTDVLRTR